MFELIEISKGIKTFCFNSFIRKTISNFLLLFLEELIWENKNSKYYFVSNQTYASLFAKKFIQMFYIKWSLHYQKLTSKIKVFIEFILWF
jgi:hypothetical protein